jgi:hypothetical protein
MEMIPPLRSTKALIVGKGPGWELARDFFETDYNIWVIPQSYGELENIGGHRLDLVFEVHNPDTWRRRKSILYRVNTQWAPPKLMVPQRVSGWTDNSYLLPIQELQALGLPLLNSFAWMVAYALHRGIDTIALRGVNLDFAHEALRERDGLMYILGYLKAAGINLDIERSSGLVRGNGLWVNLIS